MVRSKFDDPDSHLYPPGITCWKRAQLDVDTSPTRFLYEKIPTDTAYVVPEPSSLISRAEWTKSAAMIRSWLKYRPLLIFRLTSATSIAQPKHGKAWSALLSAEYSTTTAEGLLRDDIQQKETHRLREEMASFLSNSVGSDDVRIADELSLSTATSSWQGIAFDSLEAGHFEQILWELAELNFRFEFQALDRRARLGTPFQESVVDESLSACFPDRSLAVPSLFSANHGIASTRLRERAHYLFAMARVMSKWKGINNSAFRLISQTGQLRWSAKQVDTLETEIATFYTQSFYDYFRRPCVLPRQLSECATQALPYSSEHLPLRQAPFLDGDPTVLINDFESLA